jgi:superfamily II DNA or RNA helicase
MTDKTFITNEDGKSLKDRFVSLIKDTKYFDVLVGYFYTSGFKSIYKSLEPTEKIRILIGISTNKQTVDLINQAKQIKSHHQVEQEFSNLVKNEMEESPDNIDTEESVRKFVEWIGSKKIELRAYPEETIHSKLYIMTFGESDRDKGRVITGSSNFTQNGLISNIEFNVELKNVSDYEFAKSQFEKLWAEGVDVSEKYIETIEKETWLKEDITPYELYLKFLYEYFKEEINQEEDLTDRYRPEGFKDFKYQEHAVINAKRIVNEHGGVFISDVVGLGKTFMGTMLCQELGGTTLVIAPPHLISEDNPGSWNNAFKDFGFRAKDFICVSKGIIDQISNKIDLSKIQNVLIDEAHNYRTEDTVTYTHLSSICKNKKVILITATPYNNSPKDLLAQIKLFQPIRNSSIPNMKNIEGFFNVLEKNLKGLSRIDNPVEYIEKVKANASKIRTQLLKYIMVRRTRREISDFYTDDLKKQGLKFPNISDPISIFYEFSEDENKLFEETLEIIARQFYFARYRPLDYLIDKSHLKTIDKVRQTNITQFMKILIIKRLESSYFAFKNTIKRFIESYDNFIEQYKSGQIFISKKHTQKIFDYIEEGNFEKIEELVNDGEAERYSSSEFNAEFIENLYLDRSNLKKIEMGWDKIKLDSKLNAFKNRLHEDKILQKNKKLIFTESSETAEYLYKELQSDFNGRIINFTGNSSHSSRLEVLNNFDNNAKFREDKYDVLITTDVLAEGVNLHRANIVINYDIPWNPTKIMQRVGRINRVDTPHENLYTYNFFPTIQSDNEIGLKQNAIAKIEAFISLLGVDAKLLTDNEEVEAHSLFDKIVSKASIEGDEGDIESEIGYLQEIRKIRDSNLPLFTKIKFLPKKCRAAKLAVNDKGLLTYLRKGKLHKFYYSSKIDSANNKEFDFIESAHHMKASPDDPKGKFDSTYFELLKINKEALENSLSENLEEQTLPSGGMSNLNKLHKLLTTTQIKNYSGYTEDDEIYLSRIIREIDNGSIAKGKAREVLEEISKPDLLNNPIKLINRIKDLIPENELQKISFDISQTVSKKEVILSGYFN